MKETLPHGGKLVNRVVQKEERENLKERCIKWKKLILNEREISDLYMISVGCFFPLEGFMKKDDYQMVVEEMRLKNGPVWPIPITLSIDKEEMNILKTEECITLVNKEKKILGFLEIEEVYS